MMLNPHLQRVPTEVVVARGTLVLVLVALALHAGWVMAGHSTHWFVWAFLIMVASVAAGPLTAGSRWHSTARAVKVASVAVTGVGILVALTRNITL